MEKLCSPDSKLRCPNPAEIARRWLQLDFLGKVDLMRDVSIPTEQKISFCRQVADSIHASKKRHGEIAQHDEDQAFVQILSSVIAIFDTVHRPSPPSSQAILPSYYYEKPQHPDAIETQITRADIEEVIKRAGIKNDNPIMNQKPQKHPLQRHTQPINNPKGNDTHDLRRHLTTNKPEEKASQSAQQIEHDESKRRQEKEKKVATALGILALKWNHLNHLDQIKRLTIAKRTTAIDSNLFISLASEKLKISQEEVKELLKKGARFSMGDIM